MNHRSLVATFMSLLMLVSQCLLVPAAHAAMVGTDTELARAERAQQEQQIVEALSREEARATLARYGVQPEQVEQRLSRLTDAEVNRLAQQADNLPAGESVLGALVLILVILVVLDLLGATDIFPAIDAAN